MRELHIEPMGGKDTIVEANEKYVGGLEKNKHTTFSMWVCQVYNPLFFGHLCGKSAGDGGFCCI